jgi:hypothetical protein
MSDEKEVCLARPPPPPDGNDGDDDGDDGDDDTAREGGRLASAWPSIMAPFHPILFRNNTP